MTETPVLDPQNLEQVTRVPARRPASGLVRYLAVLVAVPLVIYLLPFLLTPIPGYLRWGGSQFSPALDYGFNAVGEDADVVIFGDSSALYGIAPVQMSAALGAKVINLPNTVGALPLINDMVLRHYLHANRAPKVIVFYFTPWNLNYSHQQNRFSFEAEEMILRHASLREIAALTLKHPLNMLVYPLQAYATGPKASFVAALRHQDRFSGVKATRGHMESSALSAGGRKAVPSIQNDCIFPQKVIGSEDFSSVQDLIHRFSTPATKVVVFLAPIPACQNAGEVLNRPFAEVSAAPPRLLDPGLFRDDGFYIHVDPRAVPIATETLTAQVRVALASQTTQP